jgi:hypothetical protein
MFIGHFGVGFAAKRLAPQVSLGSLFFSAEFLDLLWPIFLLTGLEHMRIVPGITRVSPFDFYDYPISHSLVAVFGWSILVGLLYYSWRLNSGGAWVLGACVASHWVLDFIAHRPDMPILPHGPYVGLGLWNSLPGSIAAEVAIFGFGLLLYVRGAKPLDRQGRYALAGLAVFLLIAQAATYLAPPPPSVQAVAWGALSIWLLVLWGAWIDRHRRTAGPH